MLGEGAYAKVKLAFSQKENKEVAVKVFEKRRLPYDYLKKFLPREIKILGLLQHPHLVCFLYLPTFQNHIFFLPAENLGSDWSNTLN